MADPTTPPATPPPAGQAQGQPQQPPSGDGGTPAPVPYERFKEVNEAHKALEARLKTIEDERKRLDDARLVEEKKWQDLAEKREAELKAERLERLRLQVATKKGLPVDLAARLVGSTEDELSADAERLLPLLKPATGPGVPPAGGGTPPPKIDLNNMSAAQVRKHAAQKMGGK